MVRVRFIISLFTFALALFCQHPQVVFAQPVGDVYVADPGVGHIVRYKTSDGPNDAPEQPVILPPGADVAAMAIDELRGKIYWTDPFLKTVSRANLNGSPAEPILPNANFQILNDPRGIAIDQAQGFIYWGDAADDKIYRSRLDGTNVSPIVAAGAGSPHSIAPHLAQGKIYWVDTANNVVNRNNIEGGGIVENLFSPGVERTLAGGLALDRKAGKMYVSILKLPPSATPVAEIERRNLDGSAPETIITDLFFEIPNSLGLELSTNPANSRIFWLNTELEGLSQSPRQVFRSPIVNPIPAPVGFGNERPTYMVLHLPCGPSSLDSDGDGTPDCSDNCILDPNKQNPGVCGCGVPDTDSDGDGTPNCVDQCAQDPNKTVPGTCGCGVSDADSDGDGTPNCNDGCPTDANKVSAGSCGCGVADVDSDNDGVLNCLEQCQNDPAKTVPGVCGCGVPDIDTDSDGTLNCFDGCPANGLKVSAGVCGCDSADSDSDSDQTLDCLDGCPSDALKTAPDQCGCNSYVLDAGKLGIQCLPDPASCSEDRDGDGTADCFDGCPTDPEKLTPDACGCEFYENRNDPEAVACEEDPLLAFESVIIAPPTVIVRDNDVTVILKRYSGVLQTSANSPTSLVASSASVETAALLPRSGAVSFRYDIRLRPVGKGSAQSQKDDIRRKTTKRNSYTFKDLSPGTYTVKYRAQITRKKKVVDNTNFSPAARFVIP